MGKNLNPIRAETCAIEGKIVAIGDMVKRATAGFIVSIVAGILILVNALMFAFLAELIEGLEAFIPFFVAGILTSIALVGVILAFLVVIGAILIYIPGRETVGGVIVIIFSILSIFIGGGFLLGLVLGIIGGILGLFKK
ncbi:MAG: hypothetical protein JSW53_02590 [Candidatus Bathyarchaeota archaeon]|nr:MAG: hypothetical protein JSW53_02590 [Candidatus Bathyarchaeota archaeon]